jgi:hypothetical protein
MTRSIDHHYVGDREKKSKGEEEATSGFGRARRGRLRLRAASSSLAREPRVRACVLPPGRATRPAE